ncbi:MAG: leucyl aminopeptidase family protein [Oscillospiraceae bacterium]
MRDIVHITPGRPDAPQGHVRFYNRSEGKLPAGYFSAKYLETRVIGVADSVTLNVGMGEDAPGPAEAKELLAKASSEMKKLCITRFDVQLSGNIPPEEAVEGLLLGLYDYSLLEREQKTYEIGLDGAVTQEQIDRASAVAEGTLFARDLVNTPANLLHPEDMAAEVTAKLSRVGVQCETIHLEQLREMGMNGLRLIGESSANPPCLLVMRWLPMGNGTAPTGLVGKGVTFDSGGYCLKPGDSMTGSKGDMAGAAAVAGAIYALAKNKVQANVVGVTPLCENRISDASLLPGDVYTSYSGKKVEVLNVDAEGRLILSDAVAYAIGDEKVDKVLDIATLTGAAVRALGFGVAPVVGNSDSLWEEFTAAFAKTGERYWRMPTYPEYRRMLDSDIADIKNLGKPEAGCITGGLFIGDFVGDTPWLHLDIAGTAWVDPPLFAFQCRGATGAGVTTLYRFCAEKK